MSSWAPGGLAAAALVLIAGEVIVSSSDAGGILTLAAYPASLAAAWMDPSRPLIPRLAGTTTSSTGGNGKSKTQSPPPAPPVTLDVATIQSA